MGLFLTKLLKQNPKLYDEAFAGPLVKLHMEDPDYIPTFTREQMDLRKFVITELLYKSDYKIHIVTQKAGENEIMKIKIKDTEAVVKLLNNIPNKRGLFVMNKDEFFKYFILDDDLYVIWAMVDNKSYVTYSAFHLVTSTGYIGGAYNDKLMWTLHNFLKVLIYTYYSKNNFVFVNPGQKHGKTLNEKIHNESIFPVTVIDSFWNKTIIRLEGFDVNGHFRFQACGKNWSQRELKWINGFRKHHYIRTTKHEN